MRKRNYARWLEGLRELCLKSMVVGIILIALSMWSCSTSKQMSQSHNKETIDSLVIKETQEVTAVTVPESKVEMAITLENLRNLPEGATYNEKSGQASAEVRYVPPNPQTGQTEYIIITSTCDSLQVLCWRLEKELIRIRNDTEREVVEIKEDASKQKNRCLWIGFICGVCVVIVINLVINKIRKYVKKE